MHFDVITEQGVTAVEVPVRRLLIAGFTGRDQAAVQAHVQELAEHGIAGPSRVPSLFPCVPRRLTTAAQVTMHGARTSGEAEFVLTRLGGELLVGVGSDHTDRELEAHSIIKSKQACDKVVAPTLWPAAEVRDQWDSLQLTATAWDESGTAVTYQEGTLASMLHLDDLIKEVEGRVGPIEGDILYGGTLPLLTEDFVCGHAFRAELRDPGRGRHLACEYQIHRLPQLDD